MVDIVEDLKNLKKDLERLTLLQWKVVNIIKNGL